MNEVPPRRYLAHYQFVQYNNNTIQYIPSTQQHGMPENPVSTAAQARLSTRPRRCLGLRGRAVSQWARRCDQAFCR